MYQGTSRALFARFALPQMVGLLFNSVYVIVDGVFIGHRLGTDSMAAAAVSVPLIEILIALSMAIASGAGVLISGYLSRGEKERAVNVFNTAFICAVGLGVIIIIFGNLFIDGLAVLLGSTEDIHGEATEYMRYIVSFAPFQILSFLLSGLVRNEARPKLAMIALAVGSCSNIALDWLFMYPLNLGICGAALATALGPIFSVLILLPHFIFRRGQLHFALTRPSIATVGNICSLGFPSFIMEFTIGIITFVYNAAIVRCGYGELGLAAYLVIGYLMLIILTLFLGMAEGLQPVFSHFTGTAELKRCRELRSFSAWVFLGMGIVCYVLILFFARYFFALFNPDDAELLAFLNERSAAYFCGFPLAGYGLLMISYWQSTRRTGKALAVSLSRSLIWPPILALALPAMFGRETLWLVHSLSEVLAAVTAFIIMLSGERKGSKRLSAGS